MLDLISEAKKKFDAIAKKRNTPRFKKVIECLIHNNALQPTEGYHAHRTKIKIKDCLWAAQIEPRIYEVLPALILKKPGIFEDLGECPPELKKLLLEIRNAKATRSFHGIPARDYLRWIPHFGHEGVKASCLKSFRLSQDDLAMLHALTACGYSEIGAIRAGLKLLSEKTIGPL